jgi:predicted nucleic-acid-binding protein
MIGIDANILIRIFLEDDLAQAEAAKKIMKEALRKGKLFISSYTIQEFIWVLKIKKINRKDIYEALITLVDSPGIVVGQRDVVLSAAEKYYKGKAEFSDYMILAEGEKNGSKILKTFDKTFSTEMHH